MTPVLCETYWWLWVEYCRAKSDDDRVIPDSDPLVKCKGFGERHIRVFTNRGALACLKAEDAKDVAPPDIQKAVDQLLKEADD